MITVHYSRKGGQHELSVDGHAGYAEMGDDIVCAGVSALVQALIGWLDDHSDCVAEMWSPAIHPGHFWVRCKGNKMTTVAFQMAVTGLKQIADAYPCYVELLYTGSDR